MPFHLDAQADLETAMTALVARDARLKPILAATGMPALRRRAPGFAGLAATICGQQLSTTAAAAIWARMAAAYDDPLEHHHIRLARDDRLKRFGLSVAKIRTLKFIASEIHDGRLDLAALAEAPADDAHNTLTALHGIGPWTADIYLLFCLGHGDAWPAGDLAIQEAIRVAFALDKRPSVKETMAIGDAWRPWRGVAAHLFWAYYRVAKSAGFSAAPPDAAAAAPKIRTAAAKPAGEKPGGPAPGGGGAQKPAATRRKADGRTRASRS